MDYLLVIMSAAAVSLDFVFTQKYQKQEGADIRASFLFNALNGLFAGVIFFAISGWKLPFAPVSAIYALGISLCAMAYMTIGFRILKFGNVAVYSLFLMSGSMLLPYLFGVIFLEERLSVFRVLGALLILAGVVLMNRSDRPISAKQILLCTAVFLINGVVSILSKCHQITTAYETVNPSVFVIYTGLGKGILSCAILPFLKPQAGKKAVFSRKISLLLVACSALAGGGSYMLQLTGAKNLPATVLYPMITGGSIIFSALAGRMAFGEKLSRWQIASIALCFAGTLLFL